MENLTFSREIPHGPVVLLKEWFNVKTNTFMGTLKLMPALGAFLLVAGCNSSTDTVSNDTANTPPRADNKYADTTLKATSNTNESDRVYSAQTTATATTTDKKADNTGLNERDRNDATLTPGDQGKSEADRETTRNVRKAIMGNDSLSTMAKNIKIITIDGKVTLRGPVKSADEQSTIASLVQNTTGVTSVDNQLEVKTTNQ
jgi:osmotically-inducible protein OsmY